MQIPGLSAQDAHFLLFPAVLLAFYLACWLGVGRNPKIETIAPQYEPPAGVSPGIARYILTGGSDGTTLAAVLAQLAAREAIAIEPRAGSYRVTIRNTPADLAPEEAALLRILGVGDRGIDGSVVVDPQSKQQVEILLNGIQGSFRENLRGVYFRWNKRVAGIGTMATFVWALGTSFWVDLGQSPSFFLTLCLLLFPSMAGLLAGAVITSRPKRPTLWQGFAFLLIPLFFFVLPGLFIAQAAMRPAKFFVLAVLISVILNSAFIVIMRAPTAQGQKVLEHLAGFRDFLVRVEQDRLERMNTPEQKAALMNRFLPYAIALGVKEGWGDTMAAAFSNAVVER
jgi:Predicted membrane protein (DUF2207)